MKKKSSDKWIALVTIKHLNRLSIEKRISLAGWLNEKAVEIGRETIDEYAPIYRARYMK